MIQLTMTIDLDAGCAPDFMARLSEAFKALQGVAARAMAPTAVVAAPVNRGTVAPLPPQPETPGETAPTLPQPASPAAEAPKPDRKPRVPKVAAAPETPPVEAAGTAADPIDGMDDAALIVELRAAGNRVVKTPGKGAPTVIDALKAKNAKRYDELTTDDKRAVLRSFNAIVAGA